MTGVQTCALPILLNGLMDKAAAQLKELEHQLQSAELKLREAISGAEQVEKEYSQLMNWAELYGQYTFEVKISGCALSRKTYL